MWIDQDMVERLMEYPNGNSSGCVVKEKRKILWGDGVFEVPLGSLGDEVECLAMENGNSSVAMVGLWWLIADEEDGEV
ncbi:hypothetical protein Tco_0852398 [Tanacetum coccineum]